MIARILHLSLNTSNLLIKATDADLCLLDVSVGTIAKGPVYGVGKTFLKRR